MKKTRVLFMAALSLLFFVSTADCALVTGEFSGMITEVTDRDGVLSGTDITANTSTFTGTFSYDTSSPRQVDSSPVWTFYLGVNLTLTIDDAYEYAFNTPSLCGADVFNDDMMFGDYLRLYGENEGAETPFEHFSEIIYVWLGDSSQTAFSDLSLPSSLDLANFDLAKIMLTAKTADGSSFSVQGAITSLSTECAPNPPVVPIPGAVWLLGSGLAGLIGLRRKVGK